MHYERVYTSDTVKYRSLTGGAEQMAHVHGLYASARLYVLPRSGYDIVSLKSW